MTPRERAIQAFGERFGRSPSLLVRAPGRVNLIGEHTDYNDGFVLPMAIDRDLWAAVRPSGNGLVTIHSADFGETAAFVLDAFAKGEPLWLEYAKGVAWALREAGCRLQGFTGVIAGDVPIGAGLSSSAAFEMAMVKAFAAVSGFTLEIAAMARTGRACENQWIGAQTGIMDQTISAGGVAGHAILLDCRSLERTPVPLPQGVAVVVLDTATRRGLVGSAYNERRAQCAAGARHFGKPALRDVSVEEFEAASAGLEETMRRRVRHVVTENARTLAAADALRAGDAAAFGRLMDASHASLRDDFEVSSLALDAMVDCAHGHAACLGARMTGGGFGGCAVALVRENEAEGFIAETTAGYAKATGREASCYRCRPVAGAEAFEYAG